MACDPIDVAQIIHATMRAYSIAIGEQGPHMTWAQTSSEHRRMVTSGVIATRQNPDRTPEQSHEAWIYQMSKRGWGPGPTRNPVLRQHPCMVPWAELPPEQQKKDELFLAIVRILA